ncbi:MAG: AAA family ATPase [Spirochaetaceae bacterium]|nr:AAA family ATPase [Spirochaetaceae bacterium]
MEMFQFLQEEGVSPQIIQGIKDFRAAHRFEGKEGERIPVPRYRYYGPRIWEQAAAALLCGQNLLLVGQKASGKNVLAENLAAVFGRPIWDISCHVNTDADSLIGTDTFRNGQVEFRPGPVYRCATEGGFGVLDEINMAKNEALAVLHALLDFRRVIDVPGYQRLAMNPATRFIATMNQGYAGTRDLNEALASRFVVIMMPEISSDALVRLLTGEFPELKLSFASDLGRVFVDIQKKTASSEISSRLLDLRGLLDSIRLMRMGIEPWNALDMGITNKSSDEFERSLLQDIIRGRIPEGLTMDKLFEDKSIGGA